MAMVKHILVTVCVLTFYGFVEAAIPKPLLTIYYESNCPDSKRFVTQQLLPAMRRLQGLVRLRFVPFGKATSIEYGFGGFECQHGPNECLGNMIQDCALELMDGRSDWEKLLYVACEMETYAASNGNFKCAVKSNVAPKSVQHCVNYDRGTILQLNSEYMTSLVPNTKEYIPTITINNEFSQEVQDYAMVDLLGALCGFISHAPACATHYNHQAWRRIMYEHENLPALPVPYNNIK